jgi:excisionase family DNA binding protein
VAATAPPIPRVALRPDEAASALGVSRDYFDDHIAHELPWIRRGRLKLVPLIALEKWAAKEAEMTFAEAA